VAGTETDCRPGIGKLVDDIETILLMEVPRRRKVTWAAPLEETRVLAFPKSIEFWKDRRI
jgi:hypothetical protein